MENIITIINCGLGNLSSISNMLTHLNIPSIIADDPHTIQNAKKLILPGVGAFDTAIKNLKANGIWDMLNYAVIENKIPILGLCLGMQMMTKGSEEGQQPGFGWVNAVTKKFPSQKQYRIPHIGWSEVKPTRLKDFFKVYNDELKFYFAHSYFVECFEAHDIVATTAYGTQFTSMFQKDNMIGVQFHPEKSHHYGMAFLDYFALNFPNE